MDEIRRIDRGILDQMKGEAVYSLGRERYIALKTQDIEKYGLENMFRHHGIEYTPSTDRLPVFQRDVEVGSLPADFDPQFAKSKTPLYDIRTDDFRRDGNRWIASPTLGLGDLEALSGFVAKPSQR